jgi:transposase-like protein
MGYSPERKAAVLKRMLPPNNMAIRQLSQEEGISEATLDKWRAEARDKGQLLPDADAGPEGWSSRDKFAAVLETAALNEADLAEYCRKRGLYPAQITAWRSACEQANDWDRASTARVGQATKEEKKRVKDLERELALNDANVLPEHEIMGILKDAALSHEKAEGSDDDLERHRAAADLINRIISGGDSVRRARKGIE